MPIHDWSGFDDGIYHNQQLSWAVAISGLLNIELLPKCYYSLTRSMDFVDAPNAVDDDEPSKEPPSPSTLPGMFDARDVPPHVHTTASASDSYVTRRKRVLIHRDSDHQVVAAIEILSPGNKRGRRPLDSIVQLIADHLRQERQVLVIDISKPTRHAPDGIHQAIFEEFGQDSYKAPDGKPFTLAAYTSGLSVTAYVEPVGLGELLPPMPLFLDPNYYVMIPLEETYMKGFSSMPRHFKAQLNKTIDRKS